MNVLKAQMFVLRRVPMPLAATLALALMAII